MRFDNSIDPGIARRLGVASCRAGVLVLLRREITGLFGRVRKIEGAGTKVSLDPTKVEPKWLFQHW